MAATMEVADISVVVIYFVLVLAVGLHAVRRANRSTVSGYFLAGRSMNWAAVGASLFVSNIGSEHFIGLAGSGAASGLSVSAWELNSIIMLQLLGWVFIPVYIHCGVSTMPEYLSKRFGGKRLKVYFAALSLIMYIFTKLSVNLYSGALFIQESLGWNLYMSVIVLIAMTAVLTVTGGLVAVIYTDTLQAILMITGALCLTAISLVKVGGLQGVMTKYMQSAPNVTAILLSSPNLTYSESCLVHLHPKPDALKVFRHPTDPDMPWPGFVLGQTPVSIWYWCTDQVIVQRVLAAKNIAHAKGSTIMAGFLKILPMFIIVIPGMISRILFADELVCISPDHCMEVCGSPSGCSNVAYPRLVMSLMPVGLRGLMMAVIIAALMSDLDSVFNSASTIFTLDIYKMLKKSASSWELVVVGRLFVVALVLVSIAWVPFIVEMQGSQIYYYIVEVMNYLTPPVAALFLLGIFWPRCNETGAFWGGLVGFVLGAVRLILAFSYHEPLCGQPDERPSFVKDFHFMYLAAVFFWVSALVVVVVSLCTPPPSEEQTRTTTLWGLKERKRLKLLVKAGEDVQALKPLNIVILNEDSNGESQDQIDQGDAPPNGDVETHHGEERGEKASEEEAEGGSCMKALNCFQEKPSETQELISVQDQEKIIDERLHEPPRIRILLDTGVVVICIIGLFLCIYFSV